MKKIVCAVLALAMVFSVAATGFVIESSAKPKSVLDRFAEAQDSLFYNGITWAVRGTSLAASVGLLKYTYGTSKGAPDYKGLNRGNYYAPGYAEYTKSIETFIEAYNEIFGVVVDENDPDKEVKRLTQEMKYKDRSGVNEKYTDYGVPALRGFTRYVSGVDPELVVDQKAQIYLDENQNWIINGVNQSLADYFGVSAPDLAAKFQSWLDYLNGPEKLGTTDFAQLQSNWFEMARYGGLWGVKNVEEAYAAFGLNIIEGKNPAYNNEYFFKYNYNTEKVDEALAAMAAWLGNKVANSFDFTPEDELEDGQTFGADYSNVEDGEIGFPVFAGLGDALVAYSSNAKASKLSASICATGKNAGKVNYSGEGKGEGLAGKSIVDLFVSGIDNGDIESEVAAADITGAYLAEKFGEWLAYIKENYETWKNDLSNLNKTFYQKVVAGDLDILAEYPAVWEAKTEADFHDIFDINGEVEFYMWLVDLLENYSLISDGKVLTAVAAYDLDSRSESVAFKDTLKINYYKITKNHPYYNTLKNLGLVTDRGFVYTKDPEAFPLQKDYGVNIVNAQLSEFIVYADSLYYFTKRATEENMDSEILQGLNDELEICISIMEAIEEKLKGEVGKGLDKPTGKTSDGSLSGYAAAVQKYVNWISYNAKDANVYTLSAEEDEIVKINLVQLAGKGYVGVSALSEFDKMYTIEELCELNGNLAYWLTSEDGFITALNDARDYDGEGELYIDFIDYYKDCINDAFEEFVDAVKEFLDDQMSDSAVSFNNSDNTILCIKKVLNATEPLSIRVDPVIPTQDEDKSYLIDELLGRYFFLFVGDQTDNAVLSNNKLAPLAAQYNYGFNAVVGAGNKQKDDLCWFYNYSKWLDNGDEGNAKWNWIVYSYTDAAKVIVEKFICTTPYATEAYKALREFIGQAATVRFYGKKTAKEAFYDEEARVFWSGKYKDDPENYYGSLTEVVPRNTIGISDEDMREINSSYFTADAFDTSASVFYRWNEIYPLNVYPFDYKTNSYPPKAPEGANVYEKICSFIEEFAKLLKPSGSTTGSASIARLVDKIEELDAFADDLAETNYVDQSYVREFKALTSSAVDLIPDDFGAPAKAIYRKAYDMAFGEGLVSLYQKAVDYLKDNILELIDGGDDSFDSWDQDAEATAEDTTLPVIIDYIDATELPTEEPTEAPTLGAEVSPEDADDIENRVMALYELAELFIERNYIVKDKADAFMAAVEEALMAGIAACYDGIIYELELENISTAYDAAVEELKNNILFEEGRAAFDAWEIAAKADHNLKDIMAYLGGTDGKYWKYFDIIANTLLHLDTGVVKPTEAPSGAATAAASEVSTEEETEVPIEDVTGNAYYGKGMYDYLIEDILEAYDGVVSWYNAFDLEFDGLDWIHAAKLLAKAKEAIMVRDLVTLKEIGKDKNDDAILTVSAIDPNVPMSYFFELLDESLALMEEIELQGPSTLIDDYCEEKHKELNDEDAEIAELRAALEMIAEAMDTAEEYEELNPDDYTPKSFAPFRKALDDLEETLDDTASTLPEIQTTFAAARLARRNLVSANPETCDG